MTANWKAYAVTGARSTLLNSPRPAYKLYRNVIESMVRGTYQNRNTSKKYILL